MQHFMHGISALGLQEDGLYNKTAAKTKLLKTIPRSSVTIVGRISALRSQAKRHFKGSRVMHHQGGRRFRPRRTSRRLHVSIKIIVRCRTFKSDRQIRN